MIQKTSNTEKSKKLTCMLDQKKKEEEKQKI